MKLPAVRSVVGFLATVVRIVLLLCSVFLRSRHSKSHQTTAVVLFFGDGYCLVTDAVYFFIAPTPNYSPVVFNLGDAVVFFSAVVFVFCHTHYEPSCCFVCLLWEMFLSSLLLLFVTTTFHSRHTHIHTKNTGSRSRPGGGDLL